MADSSKTAPSFGVRLPYDVLAVVDAHRKAMPYPPSRSRVVQTIMTEWAAGHPRPSPRVPLEDGKLDP